MTATATKISKRIQFFALLLMVTLCSTDVYSQSNASDKEQYYELTTSLDGVFQIQMINIRSNPSYDTDLLVKIKEDQKENEQVIFYYKNKIRIVILSKAEVQSGMKFQEDQRVVYLNE